MTIVEEMTKIVDTLNEWTDAYDKGLPIVTDKEWDTLYFKLKELEKKHNLILNNSPTNKVHYEIKTELKKVKHNHNMLSLDKTKDWEEYINYFAALDPIKYVCNMLKMDGLTCSLRYLNGKLVSAETRGNGEVGEDILHNAKTIKSIPQEIDYLDELIIDGEVICTYSDFEKFSDLYKNPRNFASGSIRLLDANECNKRHLTFVAWNVIKGFDDDNSFISRLEKIRNLGFVCVPYTMSLDQDAKDYLIDIAQQLSYPIDGLVARFDDIAYGNSLGETGHHARAAFAFKFYDETYDTVLTGIEWTMGRTGILTPVAIFEPLDIDGSVVSRASLHNLSVMEDLLGRPYWRQPIKIFKANMIIPQVESAIKRNAVEFKAEEEFITPGICPICGEETQIVESDSGVKVLICTNPQCQGKLINIVDHFAGKKGLDIKGLSKSTFGKLIDWGWINNIEDIFALKEHRNEWIKKDGFGVKSVDNILSTIEEARTCDLGDFITSIGIPLIGKRYAKIVAEKEKTWEQFISDVESNYKFYTWDGFGPEMNEAILSYDYTLAKHMVESGIITFKEAPKEEKTKTLSGLKVVITGKLALYKNRNELKDKIESLGGQVIGSVSKNTSVLINNDVNSTSSKNAAAKKLGIPILSEEEFNKIYF